MYIDWDIQYRFEMSQRSSFSPNRHRVGNGMIETKRRLLRTWTLPNFKEVGGDMHGLILLRAWVFSYPGHTHHLSIPCSELCFLSNRHAREHLGH
jgi:hypothetical protein